LKYIICSYSLLRAILNSWWYFTEFKLLSVMQCIYFKLFLIQEPDIFYLWLRHNLQWTCQQKTALYSSQLTNHVSCSVDSWSMTKIQTDSWTMVHISAWWLLPTPFLIDTPADVPPFPAQIYIYMCTQCVQECRPKWCAN